MLYAVAELSQHVVRNIGRVLRNKPDADAFRADQADHLFNLIQQNLWRIVKQQVRLVEEEDQLGFVEIAGFR